MFVFQVSLQPSHIYVKIKTDVRKRKMQGEKVPIFYIWERKLKIFKKYNKIF